MIFYNLSMDQYLAHEAIGSSHLRQILISPRDFKSYPNRTKQETQATELGTAIHTLILEPDEFDSRYALQPEDWGPRNKGEGYKNWNAFKKDNADKICLNYEQAQYIRQLDHICDSHRGLNKIIKEIGGRAEVTGFRPAWLDSPLQLKSRTDWLGHDGILWDVKSSSKGLTEFQLIRTIEDMNYDFQLAHHHYVISNAVVVNGWGWIFISTDSPGIHIVTCRASDGLMDIGRDKFDTAMEILRDCFEADDFTGSYTHDDIFTLERDVL